MITSHNPLKTKISYCRLARRSIGLIESTLMRPRLAVLVAGEKLRCDSPTIELTESHYHSVISVTDIPHSLY
jgi:hypothetical protein